MPIDLIEAARTGGPVSVELLLRRVWPDAFRLARAVLGEEQRAQDAAQEACIAIYRSIKTLRSAQAFRVWFYRIVVREANQLKRGQARVEPTPQTAATPAADYAGTLDVWRALFTLPEKLRDVVILRYFEDLSSREIAAVLGVPDGTVRFRLMIARQQLRPLLDDGTGNFTQKTAEARINAI